MIAAMKTPMAALRAHRQNGYSQREVPAYLCLGGTEAAAKEEGDAEKGPRGPRIVNIESAPRTADPRNP